MGVDDDVAVPPHSEFEQVYLYHYGVNSNSKPVAEVVEYPHPPLDLGIFCQPVLLVILMRN